MKDEGAEPTPILRSFPLKGKDDYSAGANRGWKDESEAGGRITPFTVNVR